MQARQEAVSSVKANSGGLLLLQRNDRGRRRLRFLLPADALERLADVRGVARHVAEGAVKDALHGGKKRASPHQGSFKGRGEELEKIPGLPWRGRKPKHGCSVTVEGCARIAERAGRVTGATVRRWP